MVAGCCWSPIGVHVCFCLVHTQTRFEIVKTDKKTTKSILQLLEKVLEIVVYASENTSRKFLDKYICTVY
jgi:hypothetical protein